MGSTSHSKMVVVINKTGIHARPASKIFQLAKSFKSNVSLKKDSKEINAKSVIAILSLGIKLNDTIEVITSGDDAEKALNSITSAIESGLGETDAVHKVAHTTNNTSSVEQIVITDFSSPVTLSGIIASPGFGIGSSALYVETKIEVNETTLLNASEESKVFQNTLNSLVKVVSADMQVAKANKHTVQYEIFAVHLDLISDPYLLSETHKLIDAGKSTSFAWQQAILKTSEMLINSGNALLQERVADLKDLEKRLLKILMNIEDENINYSENTIIIASDLVPSDIAKFNNNVIGVVLAKGSATAHVSLMLRNRGIATMVGVGSSVLNIKNNTNIILNTQEGFGSVIINASQSVLEYMKSKQIKLEEIRQQNIANSKFPAITTDGVNITVLGNVSNPQEAGNAYKLGGEGIGLLRTEFLFFNSQNAPSEEVQHNLYQHALNSMSGNHVVIRTLDVGGDKPLPYVKIDLEENPIMGMRGVRTYLENKEVFLTQVRAILTLKPLSLIQLMLPMISSVEEFLEIKALIIDEKNKLGITENIQIGTMIEVPSAAILADKMAFYADFLSIGTNDLAQYTLAMDRGNSKLSGKLSNLHPALLTLIKITVNAGLKHNKPVAVCGAMASEIKAIPVLVGLGVKELSASMRAIPDVKALIRTLDYKKCVTVANIALTMETAEQVSKLIEQEFGL